MGQTVRLVLPFDAQAKARAALAPGVASMAGAAFGIVDNGLWASMGVFGELWREYVVSERGTGVEVVPFDHLAVDFADQQRALGPFGRRVRGVVTGLGN